MALTRKLLSALGIEAEKIDEIITAHTETVDALKEQRDQYKKDAEQYKQDADKLPGVQKELDDLKDAVSKNEKDPYKVKYDALKEEFDTYKSDITAKETKAKKEKAYRELLKEAGISEKRIDAVVRVSDEAISGIEFDDAGKVKGADDVKKTIVADWSDFIQTKGKKGADVSDPPGNGGDNKPTYLRAAELAKQCQKNMYGTVEGDK